jgi:hypothetical protein
MKPSWKAVSAKSIPPALDTPDDVISDNDFILHTPSKRVHQPNDNTLRMIIDYLREIVPASRKVIKARLPENMPLWGKFRIAHGGDSIRSTMASSKKRVARNKSFVRVCEGPFSLL